jgi:hypothetical protein
MPTKTRVLIREKVAKKGHFLRKVLYSWGNAGRDEKERWYNRNNNYQVAFSRSLN